MSALHVSLVLAALSVAPAASGARGPAAAAPVALPERRLPSVEVDPKAVGMAECPSAGALQPGRVLAVCRGPASGGSAAPLRLVLLDRTGDRIRVAWEGPEAGDAYYLRPTVFQADAGPAIVLAESGAEFSYGIDVYVAGPGGEVARAGTIGLGAPGEDGPTSAVPFVRVERRGADVCVGFTRDLVRMKPDGTYAKVPKARARFVVRAGKLEASRCPAPAR